MLSLLATASRISCDGPNVDVNSNNKDYVQGVFLSVDALKDLQNRAQINNPDQINQPLTTFNEMRRPDQQIPSEQFLKTNPGLQQNYNPNGLNLVQTLNGGVPQQINPSLTQVNQPDLIAVNQNGQLVSLKPVNVQPNLVNNQIPNNFIGSNVGQPNLVLNNGQPSNQVYTVVPINNPSNQGLLNGNTYLVPLQQTQPNQILSLNNGK